MKNRFLTCDKGYATFIALIMVGMLTLIGLAAMSTSDDEVTITGNELQEARAFYAAEAALETCAARLHYMTDSTGSMIPSMPSGHGEINGCQYDFTTTDNGPVEVRSLSNGTLAGLNAQVKTYTMQATAVNTIDNATVSLTQSFERALVPIFQFAVFYNNDLEIAPGPAMAFLGRVHTNGSLWLQSENSLSMDSYITAAGDILHGRKGPGTVDDGDIYIKDGSGNYVTMRDGAGWLQSTDSYWYDSSVARWNGRVQDSTHGQPRLNIPLVGTDDPHKLIERSAGGNTNSYEEKASLKIIDGQAYQSVGGLWLNVTIDMTVKGIINKVTDEFYDQRENKWVDATELDVRKLYAEGYGPSNGVIYFADNNGDYPALRINHGDSLNAGLTIASENPVYTQGDFNSILKKPAAIIGDAVTFLSSSFNDSLSNGSYTLRTANNTTVNVSILTGNIETTGTDYNGGLENLPRFLENWSGKTFRWRGSMVNLWNSRQATGNWNNSYYAPPIRDWAYDPDLDDPANLPPESPMIRIFQRTGWKESDVSYANLADSAIF